MVILKKNLTWRVQSSIKLRMKKKTKNVLKNSLFEEKVEGTIFVYFHGITRHGIGSVRKSLSAMNIETKEVKDIFFCRKTGVYNVDDINMSTEIKQRCSCQKATRR